MMKFGADVRDLLATAKILGSQLPKSAIDKAQVRAMNYGGDRGFTAVVRQLSKQVGMTQADLKRRSRALGVKKARPENMNYDVFARSAHTPLGYFQPIQRKRGASARAWGKRRIYRGTFVATMPSGHVGIYVRVPGKARVKKVNARGRVYYSAPIRELWGPSIAKELIREPTPTIFRQRVRETTEPRLQHEIERALVGLKPRPLRI
jgi:hypothetical protein